jgi:NADP-dependent 3-hydroxy acid dehydrogenase YdfG
MAEARPIALITGATAGIGYATAQRFARAGYDLILNGRRAERLEQLGSELPEATRTLNLAFDVRDRSEVERHLAHMPASWQPIAVLVNNAGLARGLAPLDQGNVADWEEMIDTNLKGLLYVSRVIGGLMRAQGHGHIINVGSIAGKEAYPNGNVYCASKHGVDALSRAMRIDFNGSGVKVSQIAPGFVNTEFSEVRFHGDEAKAQQVYEGFRPLSGEDVAEAIYFMASAPAHVNVADMLLLPKAQAHSSLVDRTELGEY